MGDPLNSGTQVTREVGGQRSAMIHSPTYHNANLGAGVRGMPPLEQHADTYNMMGAGASQVLAPAQHTSYVLLYLCPHTPSG